MPRVMMMNVVCDARVCCRYSYKEKPTDAVRVMRSVGVDDDTALGVYRGRENPNSPKHTEKETTLLYATISIVAVLVQPLHAQT